MFDTLVLDVLDWIHAADCCPKWTTDTTSCILYLGAVLVLVLACGVVRLGHLSLEWYRTEVLRDLRGMGCSASLVDDCRLLFSISTLARQV
jgi:hypothetical protein